MVGWGILDRLPQLLPDTAAVAVVHCASVSRIARRVADTLGAAGHRCLSIEVPDAEAAKRIDVAAMCWDMLGEAGFTRTDAIVGVGGGSVTDLAGFVAACWLRGVRWVAVPTTLLGMVDAAIGGKTGLNTAAGKNLVGAFHHPAGVLCDLSTLDTLPPEVLTAGLAEVVKCGFIADPVVLDLIERDPTEVAEPAGATLRELVERSIRVKIEVVASDPRESGKHLASGARPREVLNYGHTLAHAIEHVESYRWRHGDAVAVGLVYAAALGHRLGRLGADTADRHKAILASLGLPVRYLPEAFPQLLAAMRVDKKTRGDTMRFVILNGLAKPSIIDSPGEDLLAEVYREVCG